MSTQGAERKQVMDELRSGARPRSDRIRMAYPEHTRAANWQIPVATQALVERVWRNSHIEWIHSNGIKGSSGRFATGIDDIDMMRINVCNYRVVRPHLEEFVQAGQTDTALGGDLAETLRTALCDFDREVTLGAEQVQLRRLFRGAVGDLRRSMTENSAVTYAVFSIANEADMAPIDVMIEALWCRIDNRFGMPWWPDWVDNHAELSPPVDPGWVELAKTAPERLPDEGAEWLIHPRAGI